MASSEVHYSEAERLLDEARQLGDLAHPLSRAKVEMAKAHALLAAAGFGDYDFGDHAYARPVETLNPKTDLL